MKSPFSRESFPPTACAPPVLPCRLVPAPRVGPHVQRRPPGERIARVCMACPRLPARPGATLGRASAWPCGQAWCGGTGSADWDRRGLPVRCPGAQGCQVGTAAATGGVTGPGGGAASGHRRQYNATFPRPQRLAAKHARERAGGAGGLQRARSQGGFFVFDIAIKLEDPHAIVQRFQDSVQLVGSGNKLPCCPSCLRTEVERVCSGIKRKSNSL
jgi:hypothetical protein